MATTTVAVAPPSYSEAISDTAPYEEEPSSRSRAAQERRRAQLSLRTLASSVSANLFGAPQEEGRPGLATRKSVGRTLATYRVTSEGTGHTVTVDFPGARREGRVRGPTARIGPFATEAAAHEAARNFAPPVWQEDAKECGLCGHGFAVLRRKHHCRNCGLCVCDRCCVTWPTACLPESYLAATDARIVFRASSNFAAGLGVEPPSRDLLHNWRDASSVRVCAGCDDATANFRQSLLDGVDVAVARDNLDSGAWRNVNFWRPLPAGFAVGGLLPVHIAVASGSLPLLKWLALDRHCPLVGPFALSAGDPQKSVLRLAVEHASLDALQWLLCCDHLQDYRLPLEMPPDTGVNAAVVHRCLDAALRDTHRLHALLDQVLADAGDQLQHHSATTAFHDQPHPTAPPVDFDEDDDADAGASCKPPAASCPPPQTHDAALDAAHRDDIRSPSSNECVVCFSVVEPKDLCALVPCGHACVCIQCGGSLSSCPMCRARVERAMRIFVE